MVVIHMGQRQSWAVTLFSKLPSAHIGVAV